MIKAFTVVLLAVIVCVFLSTRLFVTEKEYSVSDWNSLYVSGPIQVYYIQKDENKVVIKADNGLHKQLDVKVENKVLKIIPKKTIRRERVLKVYVSSPKIVSLHMTGSAWFRSNNVVKSKNLSVIGSGAAEIKLRVETDSLSVNMSLAANIQLAGNSNKLNIYTKNVGDLNAYNLRTDYCFLRADIKDLNSKIIRLNVAKELSLNSSVRQHVKFKGNPKVIEY